MADTSNLSKFLTDVADAIRTKKETTEPIAAEQFDQEILSIETGIDTSDATASATDIVYGKIAYGNDGKIVGTVQEVKSGSQTGVGTLRGFYDHSAITGKVQVTTNTEYEKLYRVGSILSQDIPAETVAQKIGLTPDKLMKGNTILNIEGAAEGGGGTVTVDGVKLFETVEEMNADSNAQEGDLALVYRKEAQNWDGASAITSFTFPKTVVLPSAMTGGCYGYSMGDMYIDIEGSVSASSASFMIRGNNMYQIKYTSSDGLTYTRTDTYDETLILADEPTQIRMFEFVEVCGYFIQVGGMYFEGLYEYQSYIDKEDVYTVLLSDVPFDFDATNGITNMTWTGNKYKLLNVPTIQEIANKINTETGEYPPYLAIDENDNVVLFRTKGQNYGIGDIALDMNKNLLGVCFGNSSNKQPVLSVHTLDLDNKSYTTKELSISGNIYVTSPNYKYNWSYYPLKLKTIAYHISESGVSGHNSYFVVGDTTKGFRKSYTGGDGAIAEDLTGLFLEEYDYFMAPTQLTLTSKNELLPGKIAYGKNGVVEGDTSVYDNIGLIKPMSNVAGIDINTKDLLLDPMKKMVSPKTNGTVLVDGTESYLYCRRLLPEVDMSDFGNCTVMSSKRILGTKSDSTNNTLIFKSYDLDTGELTIHNTFSTTKIADITTRSVQITDELGYVVSADKSTSKLYIYKLEGDTVEEVINTTLTLAGIYTDGVTLDLLGGANGYLYFGVLRPNNKLYIYKVVDKTLVEVKNVTLHTGFDYHNDIYCTRAGNYLYFGYFRGWSFNTNSNNQIICINTTDDSSSVITHANTSVRLDSSKIAYDNANMYLLSSSACVTITPTTMTVGDPVSYPTSGNYNYFYYDKTANILKIVGGPYKGVTFDISTGKLEAADLYYPIGDMTESLSVLDWSKLHNPDNTVFYMRQSNYTAKGFICYWLDNKQFAEDVNNNSPYFRLNDSVMFKLGHSNPRIITTDYTGTISPKEYNTALETAQDILGNVAIAPEGYQYPSKTTVGTRIYGVKTIEGVEVELPYEENKDLVINTLNGMDDSIVGIREVDGVKGVYIIEGARPSTLLAAYQDDTVLVSEAVTSDAFNGDWFDEQDIGLKQINNADVLDKFLLLQIDKEVAK